MIKGRSNSFPEIKIDKEMMITADWNANIMGPLKNSITGGEKNLIGFLGEQIVAKYLGIEALNTYNWDMMYKDKYLEIKTKDTTAYPKGSYEVSVAGYNTTQKCDYYIFTRILTDLSVGWILGYMPRDEYYKKARKLTKGDIDGTNNFEVKAD